MNRFFPILALLILLTPWTMAQELQRYDFTGHEMATTFRIACYAESQDKANAAAEACFNRISELNRRFTDYDPTSELMRLCAPDAQYPYQVSPDLFEMLRLSRDFAKATEGSFDITCGHLSQLWRRAKRQGKLPPADRLQKAIQATDWRAITLHAEDSSITLRPGTLLDLGGIAKGYAADECLKVLARHGITRAVVQAGGDTAVAAPPPNQKGWEIKIRTFSKPTAEEPEPLATYFLAHRAVSTSGDLYQFVEIAGQRYSHIMDPKTGLGLTHRIACSVFAPDCTTSDALATAFCILGEKASQPILSRFPQVEARFATKAADQP